MINRICLLLEALTVVICLHQLYGEKFRLEIKTISFFAIDMILMQVIDYYSLSKIYSMIVYPIIMVYCGIRFGFKVKAIVINNILCLVMIGAIQLIVSTCYAYIFYTSFFSNTDLLWVNIVAFLFAALLLPRIHIHNLSIYLQDKEKILIVSLALCIIFTLISIIMYKLIKEAEAIQYVPLFIGVILIFILAGQLGKYKVRSKEMETELKMNQLYSDSFNNLIEEIRMRQHEFDNHISTLYSLQYTYHNYEALIKAQEEYSQSIIQENRYNKLLTNGNPLLSGFLYGKFVKIEKYGIEVTYKVKTGNLNINIPIYKLVEILGDLINNAVDALICIEDCKALHVEVIEVKGILNMEVRNKSRFIDYSEIDTFFKKGFSKKGNNRGLGLYNVKVICNQYSLKILCENRTIDKENWFCFFINNKKESSVK